MVCDFAETYKILNIRELPASLLATLAAGLPEDSRIKSRMSRKDNEPAVKNDTLLLARIADLLALIVWSRTEDGQKGKNKPKSIVSIMLGKNDESDNDMELFDEPDEFKRAWEQAGGGVIGNGD
ncbi:MAG: DUF5361 domain-containing protein [Clostridiales bacterium]|nr:DUF5361 domain-containing protein [Clostridiales bacterium]